MEHHLRPTDHFLWGQNPRIAETGPHIKGKCTAAVAAALDMRSASCLYLMTREDGRQGGIECLQTGISNCN